MFNQIPFRSRQKLRACLYYNKKKYLNKAITLVEVSIHEVFDMLEFMIMLLFKVQTTMHTILNKLPSNSHNIDSNKQFFINQKSVHDIKALPKTLL